MTLTVGDFAALVGVFGALTGALAVIVKYFVQSEIRMAINGLRLEWAKDRTQVLEQRVLVTESQSS